jgi:hypothetical protein
MAEAKTKDAMLRVKFIGSPGPPARLEAGGVVIEAGNVGELPAALARELASNPQVGLELTDEKITVPKAPAIDPLPDENEHGPILQHKNPDPAKAVAEKE